MLYNTTAYIILFAGMLILSNCTKKNSYQLNEKPNVKPIEEKHVSKISEEYYERANQYSIENWDNQTYFDDSVYQYIWNDDTTLIADSATYRNQILLEKTKRLFNYVYANEKYSHVSNPWAGCYVDYYANIKEIEKTMHIRFNLADTIFLK